MMVTIYLCRHGNRTEDCSDLGPNPPRLTPLGQDQARRLGAYLREQNIGIILSSPKIRAIETALPLSNYIKKNIYVFPCLIEHNSFGPLDYDPKVMQPSDRIYHMSDMLAPGTPVHEEKDFACNRAQCALAHVRLLWPHERIAIFAHDCFNSIFLWAWLNRGCLMEADRYQQAECCVNILEEGKPPQINLNVLKM